MIGVLVNKGNYLMIHDIVYDILIETMTVSMTIYVAKTFRNGSKQRTATIISKTPKRMNESDHL